MRQAAAWAAIGSAANIGIIYSEALARVSGGWPWQVQHGGPGGKQALVGILIKLAVSIGVVSALSTSASVVPNAWTALVFGVGGPSIIKKVAQTYAENKSAPSGVPTPTPAPAPTAPEMPSASAVPSNPYPRQQHPRPPAPDAPTSPFYPQQRPQPPPRDTSGYPRPRRYPPQER
jgi:hypothetical protein